jgi:hypothetical protein
MGFFYLCDEIARRSEAVAVVEQVSEVRTASASAPVSQLQRNLQVSVQPNVPEFGVLDSGVSSTNPLLQGILLSGVPSLDHVDDAPDGGHGTLLQVCWLMVSLL